ncbi:hypothetical protein [Colwellia piezophila]|uniref:ApeI family dehydratase n=1 Tax=Colwellia piezophila TaxID=211668 RepID=UPI0003800D52|nr:hypothetical protein [Colwellia piezophila]
MNKLLKTEPLFIAKEIIENGVILTFKVQASLDYFKGHFPNIAILAGVVQLDWAVNFAIQYLNLASSVVKQVEILKFQEIIYADQIVSLSLTRKSDHKFLFKYHSAKGVHSSGRVLLEESLLQETLLDEAFSGDTLVGETS